MTNEGRADAVVRELCQYPDGEFAADLKAAIARALDEREAATREADARIADEAERKHREKEHDASLHPGVRDHHEFSKFACKAVAAAIRAGGGK